MTMGAAGEWTSSSLGVAGVGEQVEAADALDRQRPAAVELRAGEGEQLVRLAVEALPVALQPHRRPAVRAGHRLGVEAAVQRVGVLGGAARAHRKARHRRVRPVVGQVRDDRVARPAVGARDERVVVAAVVGVVQLGQAVGARRRVRGDERALAGGPFGRHDAEDLLPLNGGDRGLTSACDLGQGGQCSKRLVEERVHRLTRALRLDEDLTVVVAHQPRDRVARGRARDVRAEAHPLHDAGDQGADADDLGHGPRA